VLYNRALTFTSLGAEQDHEINDGSGSPIFRIHGELKHWSGSLLPQQGQYASIYQHAFEIVEQFDAPDYSI